MAYVPKKPCLYRGRALSFNCAMDSVFRGSQIELEASEESQLEMCSDFTLAVLEASVTHPAAFAVQAIGGSFDFGC